MALVLDIQSSVFPTSAIGVCRVLLGHRLGGLHPEEDGGATPILFLNQCYEPDYDSTFVFHSPESAKNLRRPRVV